jgi:hypothetical protein
VKMGCTGGAGSSFQNEWSVDFWGLEIARVGCVDVVSEGMGEADGWVRCAENSFCNVVSDND